MPRGEEAKLRRRTRKKEEQKIAMDMLGGGENSGENDFDGGTDSLPLPPGMKGAQADTDSSDDEKMELLPKKGKKAGKTAATVKSRAATAAASKKEGGGGIKRAPLILLILMLGSTLLPALIYAGDYLSKIMSKNNVLGQIGFRMGIGAVPRKRVMSFYEKHAPEKLNEVPTILAKHYGDYPLLVKKLERKYGDYGYFIGWEQDEAPFRLAMDQLTVVYDTWIQQYWNRYAPQPLKTAARNIRYNLTFLYKKFTKAWKKHVWPMLEPIFGVPDGVEKQKRQDAAEARKRQGAKQKGTRRRNTDFRDDEEGASHEQ